MSLRRITIFTLIVVIFTLLVWVLTPATIIPPTNPQGAIAAYVIILDLHPELVLPHPQGGLMMYAYGDWNYFALNQRNINNGLAALFIPTSGTLGKRTLSNVEELQQIVKQQNANLLNIKIAKVNAFKLAQSLDKRFERNIATRIQNSQTELFLVKDKQNYTILHNSNHELVVWLEQLDCQVKGFVMWANFRLKS
ncbi:DUF2459 domain-containing protein [Anabaena subtropica]|uniref:DUF2459 domain-containing protein n=1 Tax=Anabaena subtropica FACHB-260 TaxID=2692884 RepID=A0ABR8CUZ5_9NOST|nr:DUF2459 domain-containing protein [Anabaena subtropica]MBD2346047.1 DUF2459 domain-containing protein [Anabaena subtropica FACHB-260]